MRIISIVLFSMAVISGLFFVYYLGVLRGIIEARNIFMGVIKK